MSFFLDKVSQTICPGCLRTMILLISASRVAGITGVSHQHPAGICISNRLLSDGVAAAGGGIGGGAPENHWMIFPVRFAGLKSHSSLPWRLEAECALLILEHIL
jgi:hypothetical protein